MPTWISLLQDSTSSIQIPIIRPSLGSVIISRHKGICRMRSPTIYQSSVISPTPINVARPVSSGSMCSIQLRHVADPVDSDPDISAESEGLAVGFDVGKVVNRCHRANTIVADGWHSVVSDPELGLGSASGERERGGVNGGIESRWGSLRFRVKSQGIDRRRGRNWRVRMGTFGHRRCEGENCGQKHDNSKESRSHCEMLMELTFGFDFVERSEE